jgi:trigger factor
MMQVTQTLSEGLKREFNVKLTIADLEARVVSELDVMQAKANIPGFRPGKVPKVHLRRLYGKQVMVDVVNNAVTEANKKIVADNDLKLALEPQVKLPEDQAVVEQILGGKADLDLSVSLEILPKFEIEDHSDIKLEREVVSATDVEVDEALTRMAEGFRPFEEKKGKAAKGDKVIIDFLGKIDGVPFDGGKAEGHELELGSNQFIPGFEDQLIGSKAGEEKVVTVTFPSDYNAAHLAGKETSFDVKIHKVEAPGELKIDEELAKKFGMEDLTKLREATAGVIETDYKNAARGKLKRKLLDALDGKYNFDLPPTLLEQEFNNVWAQLQAEMKDGNKNFEEEGTTEEKAREEYLVIAKRRVRLGLVLAEIGDRSKVQITDEEVSQALVARARQFPGQEKQVWEYYRNNAQALAEIRAPLFEEKVVDQLLSEITLTDKIVTKEELLKDEASDDAEKPAAKPKAKAKKKSED